jgi:hypothetical protein
MKLQTAKKIYKSVWGGTNRWPLHLLLQASHKLAGRYNYTGQKCELLVDGEVQPALIVMDPARSNTVFKRQDGTLQVSGTYRTL